MGQTPENRIYLHYRSLRLWRGKFAYEFGVGAMWLHLARRWKRPVQEIKAIVKRKGQPAE